MSTSLWVIDRLLPFSVVSDGDISMGRLLLLLRVLMTCPDLEFLPLFFWFIGSAPWCLSFLDFLPPSCGDDGFSAGVRCKGRLALLAEGS